MIISSYRLDGDKISIDFLHLDSTKSVTLERIEMWGVFSSWGISKYLDKKLSSLPGKEVPYEKVFSGPDDAFEEGSGPKIIDEDIKIPDFPERDMIPSWFVDRSEYAHDTYLEYIIGDHYSPFYPDFKLWSKMREGYEQMYPGRNFTLIRKGYKDTLDHILKMQRVSK